MRISINLVLYIMIAFIMQSCSTTSSLAGGKKYTKAQLNGKLFKIPGSWEYTGLDQSSNQHFFQNDKGATGLSYNEKIKYDFHDKTQTEKEQLESYYKWESNYLKEQGQSIEILKRDEEQKYIIWKTTVEASENMFLYTTNKDKFISYVIASSEMTDTEKISYLEDFYKANK